MCYQNLIGIQDCGETTPPTSGLYTDGYGLTLNDLNQLKTADYADGYDLFTAMRHSAWELLSSDVNNKLAHWMKADTIIDNDKVGYIDHSGYTNAFGAGNFIGASLRLYNDNSFSTIFVSNITIAAETNETVTVYVLDLFKTTGANPEYKLIDSFTVTTNELTVIEKEYKTNRNDCYLAFVYESTINGQRTTVKKGVCGSCGGHKEIWMNGKIQSRGVKGIITAGVFTDLSGFGYSGGMQINYSVNCDRSAWVCSNSKKFAMAHLFKTMFLCAQFGIQNSVNERANTTVTINVDALRERLEYYGKTYTDQMNIILSNMTMPKDKDCFRCNENVRYASMIP